MDAASHTLLIIVELSFVQSIEILKFIRYVCDVVAFVFVVFVFDYYCTFSQFQFNIYYSLLRGNKIIKLNIIIMHLLRSDTFFNYKNEILYH